jgi:IMP cyclohydrolase
MKPYDLFELLNNLSYPGRGILIGTSEDNTQGVIAYFIMGRSENSRNRTFVTEGEGIRTQAFDPSKVTDPSLIIYSPVRVLPNITIVTNGDQTDTVYDALKNGRTFEEALNSRTFEPDEPNFTPRISGIFNRNDWQSTYSLSILKSDHGNPHSCQRFYFNYETQIPGQGHLITTYQNDGTPLPSFEGEPRAVIIKGDIDSFTEELWNSLNADNKVSLFVRFIDLSNGTYNTKIINKNI